jgi:hypothetical protein
MDMVDRYMQAVRFWLPRDKQDDIAAELSEELRCRREEAEERLGRPLDERETADLLKAAGNPLRMAAQYLQERPLLDPALAMIHRFAFKAAVLWVIAPVCAIAALVSLLFARHPLATLGDAVLGFLSSSLLTLGAITAVLMVVERSRRSPLAAWDPLKLPPVLERSRIKPIPRSASAFEAAFNLLFAAWWASPAGRIPLFVESHGTTVWFMGDFWLELRIRFFLPMLLLALANAAVALLLLARPHWVRFKHGYGVLSNGLGAVIALLALEPHRPEVLDPFALLRQLANGTRTPAVIAENLLVLSLMVVIFCCVLAAAVSAFRLIWPRSATGPRP